MEYARLNNWHVRWNMRKKFSRLDHNGGYKGNRNPLYIRLSGQLKKWIFILGSCQYTSN